MVSGWNPRSVRVAGRELYSTALYQKATVGGAIEELLLSTGVNGRATDWSADGKIIAYSQQESSVDIWLLPLDGDRKPVVYLKSGANEQNGRFLPDSTAAPRFMAYQSDESGQNQIYIQAIPAGAKFQVSTEGGTVPSWRRDGRELYYLSPDNRLMAAPITIGASVQVGTPQALFDEREHDVLRALARRPALPGEPPGRWRVDFRRGAGHRRHQLAGRTLEVTDPRAGGSVRWRARSEDPPYVRHAGLAPRYVGRGPRSGPGFAGSTP